MFLIGYLFARRSAIGPHYAEGAVSVALLLLVQMAIGDIQYRTHLPWGLVLVHVAAAATVWAATVAFVTLMWRPLASRRT
jgi:heme A synthase